MKEYKATTAQLEIKLVMELEKLENEIKVIELDGMNDNTMSIKPSQDNKERYNELSKVKQLIKHMLREII